MGGVGVVLASLAVAAYDRLLTDAISAAVRIDLRATCALLFGLALYDGTLPRSGWLQDQLAGGRSTLRAIWQTHP